MNTQPRQPESSTTLASAEASIRALAKMTLPVVGREPPDGDITRLIDGVRELLDVDVAIMREISGDALVLRGATGVPIDRLPRDIPADSGISQQMFTERKAIAVPDVRRHPATARLAHHAQTDPAALIFRSYAGAPMLVGDELIGILGVYTITEIREFTTVELHQLQILANHIATSVLNERLYQELHKSANMLRAEIAERQRAEIERQALESQLRLAQKMESLGRMAGGVAHDFNNLLTVLTAGIELVEIDNEPSPNTANMKQALATAAGLTKQLLAFSRHQPLQPCAVELNSFLRDAAEMLRRLLPADVALVIDDDIQSCVVEVDVSQLSQILLNLVLNARDAIADRGTIRIACRRTIDRCQPTERPIECVELTVSDNGCGMTGDLSQQVFEPFFSTKTSQGGSGLGLSTVYGIVGQLGGSITVESQPDVGSTFRVLLPRHMKEPGAITQQTGGHRTRSDATRTVLLCEDNEMVREVLVALLESAGFVVLAADTARNALQLAADHPGRFDLLITDLDLPDMRGDDLLARVREIHHGLPSLLLTGYAPDASTTDTSAFDQVLLKPVGKRALVDAIRNCMA